MNICPSCEGIIGRDCFHPEECASITHMEEQRGQQAIRDVEFLTFRMNALEEAVREFLKAEKEASSIIGRFSPDKQARVSVARLHLQVLIEKGQP